MTVEQQLRTFLGESFLTAEEADELNTDTDLLAILDSLQVLRLIMYVETTFEIKIQNSEMVPENLGSLQRLTELIDRKTKSG